jgi:hypothetical protein
VKALLIAMLGALALAAAAADPPVRIRGLIVAVDADLLAIRSREGQDLAVRLPDDLAVTLTKAARFDDIAPGDYVGATAMRRADGVLVALEVHYPPPSAPAGQTAWDLRPGSIMTNAHVEAAVASAGRRELRLKHPDAELTVVVPEGVPIVRAVPGTRADLVAGEYVFVMARADPDGRLTALRVQVSQGGVRPPQ